MNEENDAIADGLLRITDNHRNWGIDDLNREALAIEVDFSLPANRVVSPLDNSLSGKENQR